MDSGQQAMPLDKPRGILARNKQFVVSAIDLTGGTMGGVATVMTGQPLDTVKVKLQTFPMMYRGPVHCLTQTFMEQGLFRGLYAGTVPNLVSNIMENAVLFVAYGLCQKAVSKVAGKNNIKELSTFQNAIAGSCASFFSGITVSPTELVKCRLQAMIEMRSSGKLTGPLANANHIGSGMLVRHILRTEGIKGLFHGVQATLLREMPGYFCFFGGYEGCRTLLTPEGKTKDDLGPLALLFCGGMGGVAFWVSVFPADVVKSRIQVHSGSGVAGSTAFIATFLRVLREEGALALYQGLGPTIVRTFIATAALFYTYEKTKLILNRAAFGHEENTSHS